MDFEDSLKTYLRHIYDKKTVYYLGHCTFIHCTRTLDTRRESARVLAPEAGAYVVDSCQLLFGTRPRTLELGAREV